MRKAGGAAGDLRAGVLKDLLAADTNVSNQETCPAPRSLTETRLSHPVDTRWSGCYFQNMGIFRQALRGLQLDVQRSKLDRSIAANRRGERGEGRIKSILILVIFVFAIYSAVKVVPPYVAEYQLADKMQEQARFAVVNRYTEEQIRDNIYKVVQDLDIPVKREDIKVVATQQVVKISLDYIVPVDLLSYRVDLHFTPNSENKSLT